jgi:aarF domain-containing kinase
VFGGGELGLKKMIDFFVFDLTHPLLPPTFFHSQHPGNILVRLDPPKRGPAGAAARALAAAGVDLPRGWLRPSLVLLDVGMTTSLSESDMAIMYDLFAAFARNDGDTVAARALEFSTGKQTCRNPAAFRRDMAAYFDALAAEREAARAPGAAPTDGAKALAGVLELVRTHRVTLPGRVSAVLVTTLVLEGWSSRLDPHHSPIAQVEAIVAPETTLVGGAAAAWADAAARGDLRCDALVNV